MPYRYRGEDRWDYLDRLRQLEKDGEIDNKGQWIDDEDRPKSRKKNDPFLTIPSPRKHP